MIGLEDVVQAHAGLGAAGDGVGGVDADDVLDLFLGALGVGLRQVHLVQHRHHLDAEFQRGVAVGHRLRLDALAGIDDQQRAFAGRQRAADLVAEVDVARCVDQVEVVDLAVARRVFERCGLRLDGDAALALDVHRVEHLRFHLAITQAAAALDDAIGQRALAVVDVGNDREIADVIHEGGLQALVAARHNGEAVAAKAHIAKRCEGAKRRAEDKKKARRMVDAPSNRTFGNCLLGFHCSQKDRAGSRASACFSAVAGCQQEILSTRYPQGCTSLWRFAEKPQSRTATNGKTRLDAQDSSLATAQS